MSRLEGLRVLVAGAGAVGSTVAWRLARDGATVVLADPARLGDNASGVAAGMLAPAFECVLDPVSAGHFHVLKAARDAWGQMEDELRPFGAAIDRSGALWAGDEGSNAEIRAALRAIGAPVEDVTPDQAGRLSPGLAAPEGGVFTAEDWRLEPLTMLTALRQAFVSAGGVVRLEAISTLEPDRAAARADVLVLATGLRPQGPEGGPAELRLLAPIKGQITRVFSGGPRSGPAVRAKGVYVVPSSTDMAVGASMELGRDDREVDFEVVEGLLSRATALYPALADSVATAKSGAGVRAATPDGLPMAGPSSLPDVVLALGARRNGWLLAPLIARIVADRLAGVDPGPVAADFDPARFGISPGG